MHGFTEVFPVTFYVFQIVKDPAARAHWVASTWRAWICSNLYCYRTNTLTVNVYTRRCLGIYPLLPRRSMIMLSIKSSLYFSVRQDWSAKIKCDNALVYPEWQSLPFVCLGYGPLQFLGCLTYVSTSTSFRETGLSDGVSSPSTPQYIHGVNTTAPCARRSYGMEYHGLKKATRRR